MTPAPRAPAYCEEVAPINTVSEHSNYAGRGVAGEGKPITIAKNGARHIRLLPSGEQKEVLAVGLACSECLSGPQLAKVLKRGFEYEQQVMLDLMAGNYAAPLAIHTSSGVPQATSEFIDALRQHLPWNDIHTLDWCVSLQLEGASAVWAAVDMLLQEQILVTGEKNRKKVAVGSTSYHGPPSTSFGSKSPLWSKNYQVKYPTPEAGKPIDEDDLLAQFTAFLDQHGNDIGVLLIEPQWGSSQAAFPWPKELLKTYIKLTQDRGIKVCADEIMCGLGRHGHGTLFVSKAWDLNPDAITFGKAIAGGAYPLSGAIMKRGRDVLTLHGRSVMQSHTFAGSSQRALMAGTDVLNELSKWMPSITKLGGEMNHIFSYLQKISKGMLVCHGQGLMWGGLFSRIGQSANDDYRADAFNCFMKHAENIGVLPYFVPAGGFMVTPVVDIDVGTVYEIGEKLAEVVERTMTDMNWEAQSQTKKNFLSVSQQGSNHAIESKCLPSLHATKSCTSCASFVGQDRRRRFVSFQ